MANTGKHITPRLAPQRTPVAGPADDVRLSPRVEALRKLVAAGQYQVSARFLAQQIFRAAGLRVE
jgi:hypothetical protein